MLEKIKNRCNDLKGSVIEFRENKINDEKVLRFFRWFMAAVVAIWYIVFLTHTEFYIVVTDTGSDILKKRLFAVTFIAIFLIVVLMIKNKFSDKLNSILLLIMFETAPILCFLYVEYIGNELPLDMTFFKVILNLSVYIMIMLLMFAVTASIKASVIFINVVSVVFAIGNYFVYVFRGIPILASDFAIMGTAMNVAGNYEYKLTFECYFAIMLALAMTVCVCKLKSIKNIGWIKRLIILFVYIIIASLYLKVTVYSKKLSEWGISVNTFRPDKTYKKHGAALTMLRSIKYMIVEEPEGYSIKEVEEVTSKYDNESSDNNQKNVTPNVIVIMDEAFSDLQSIGEFNTNKEVTPFFNSLKEDTVKGFAYVSVFGGQTANSEFEFLTGNSKAFLPAGSTPYQMYIKKATPSLTSTLNDLNYGTLLAMHPYKGSGYNRINVYNTLGFQKFITQDDYTDPTLIRKFISDQSDFDRIISEYEDSNSKSEDPFYIFNVTMQNHSSYDTDFDNLPLDIQITDEDKYNSEAVRYLNLINKSDEALEELVNYFKGIDEPTVIVFFGDHEPGISENFYTSLFGKTTDELSSEELMEKYKVPFIIWANYDIEEKEIEATSLNYLQSIMLDAAGMETTGYNRYLLDLSKEVPAMNAIGYFGADGKFYEYDDKDSPYYDTLNEYNILEYNNMFDYKNRVNSFFYINGNSAVSK